ncbi:SCO6880 family protein [Streptomyces sp. NPDC059193]|uniref:SCO6880 family protein n=1 Tax=Streptomyces sp. NPDC059193 TaxID=3346763 RepID=UPI0036C4BDFA
MTTAYRRRRFVFGPRETDGIVLGLGMGELLTLAGAAFILIRLMGQGTGGLLLGLFILASTVAALFVPVKDRTAAQWVPIVAVFAVRRTLGMTHYRGGPAAQLARQAPRTEGVETMELPGELAGTQVLTVPTAVGEIGVVKDRRRSTYVAIIRTRGTAMRLMTSEEQDARLSLWGETLSGIAYAAGGIVRLQVIDQTVPDSGDALARQWASHGLRGTASTAANYEELLDSVRPRTVGHENYLAVMLDPKRARRQIRHLGGGDKGACAYLLQRCAQIEEALSNAGMVVEGALPPRAIAQVIRLAYEPGARWKLDARGPIDPDNPAGGASPSEAGPMAAEEAFGHYQTDDTYHAVYWISEWPRKEVAGDFMEGLILRTACERTVSVIMEPLDPRKAADEISRSSTAKSANEQTRQRWGFRQSARDRREAASVEQHDEDLASGHALYRFMGLIRISAPTLELLDQACGEIETQATALQIRRLYGEQATAFPATLPLCRGLRWGLLSDVG